MQMVIHAGKMEGDTVRIERATLRWQKLEPKTCTGTLSRQKDRLLMSLYEVENSQKRCESVLDADWFVWEPLAELPADLQGRFDVVSIAAKQLKVELGWFSATMATDKIYRLPGSNDVRVELLIDEGKDIHEDSDGKPIETPCTGIVKLEDGWLSTEFWAPSRFEPKPDAKPETEAEAEAEAARFAAHTRICADWQGRAQKFEVSLDNLPKAPIK
jgi:hypothetical protein